MFSSQIEENYTLKKHSVHVYVVLYNLLPKILDAC